MVCKANPPEIRIVSDLSLRSGNLDACDDPFALFSQWFEAARRSEPNDPEAMALATVDGDGLPDVRMVLCKGVEAAGLVFYTNTESAKGRQIEAQPKAAALFHWKSLRRQARFRGAGAPARRGRGRRLFPLPRPPVADRRLGEPAIAPARIARRAGGPRRRIRRAVRRRPRFRGRPIGAATGSTPSEVELWADGALPAARPRALHPRRRRLDAAAAQSVSEADDRLFPPRPILAVSTAVFRDGRALIARRAQAPWRGAFSLPGGVVEIGETLGGGGGARTGGGGRRRGRHRRLRAPRRADPSRGRARARAFRHRGVRRPLATRRARPQRRGRRDRLGRSPRARRPHDDAGTARHSRARRQRSSADERRALCADAGARPGGARRQGAADAAHAVAFANAAPRRRPTRPICCGSPN